MNLIDKDRIRGEEGFGDSRAVWRARLFLFIGDCRCLLSSEFAALPPTAAFSIHSKLDPRATTGLREAAHWPSALAFNVHAQTLFPAVGPATITVPYKYNSTQTQPS